ncbi:MAG: hypothetical protein HMLKMBBP_00979 [Planctomycetes bacterium]|nr:hypothetical protein [Planctomycetota bacterium]
MNRILRAAPFALWLALTWWQSSESDPAGGIELPFADADKAVHFLLYAAGGAAARLALGGMRRPSAWSAAAVLCAAWGVLDEVHQSFTPGRSPEAADAFADALGALVGAVLAEAAARRIAGLPDTPGPARASHGDPCRADASDRPTPGREEAPVR